MQKRERKIAMGLLGLAGLYIVGLFGYLTFWEPWAKRFATDAKADHDIEQRTRDCDRLRGLAARWAELGGQTYSADRLRMNDEMNRQLLWLMDDRAGLRPMGANVLADAKSPAGTGVVAKAGAVLHGQGRSEAVLRALYALRKSPLLGRLESLMIRRQAADWFEMKADYSALWLSQPTVNNTRITFAASGRHATTLPAGPASRPDSVADSVYAPLLAEKTMFTQWQPPVVTTPYVPPASQPVTRYVPPPPPPPPPKPTYRNLAVTGLYESNTTRGGFRASVADTSAGRVLSLTVGESLADGTIREINPAEGYLLLEVGSDVYVVEARPGVTVGDRVLRKDYRPVVRLPLPNGANQQE